MFIALEIAIVFALFLAGCWSSSVSVVFLPLVVASLMVFAIRIGNPAGLLVSGGGWIILDTILVSAAILANIASLAMILIRHRGPAEKPDAS